jgi:hypothetical protein
MEGGPISSTSFIVADEHRRARRAFTATAEGNPGLAFFYADNDERPRVVLALEPDRSESPT